MKQDVHILLSALDWGNGHTTRCIPLIKYLQKRNIKLTIAATSSQKEILEAENIVTNYIEINSYKISYARTGFRFLMKIIAQIPQILIAIGKENRIVKNFCKHNKVDFIISDNRFGFRNKKVYSVFMTHQVNIEAGLFSSIVNYWNRGFINKFNECWIPDTEGKINLAGKLSRIEGRSLPAKYIGWLSRFEPCKENVREENKILLILSGPEPQRTILAEKIIKQLSKRPKYKLYIAGNCKLEKSLNEKIIFLNHISTPLLQQHICSAQYIISRSGYTTIMDLVKCNRSAIVIATPGQTEQVYLAEFVTENNYFIKSNQKDENLLELLSRLEETKFKFNSINFEFYKEIVNELLESQKTIINSLK